GEIPPFDVAEVPEPLSERLVGLPGRRRIARQVPDPSRLRPRRLRHGVERRGEEGEGEEGDGQAGHGPPPDGRDATLRGGGRSTAGGAVALRLERPRQKLRPGQCVSTRGPKTASA